MASKKTKKKSSAKPAKKKAAKAPAKKAAAKKAAPKKAAKKAAPKAAAKKKPAAKKPAAKKAPKETIEVVEASEAAETSVETTSSEVNLKDEILAMARQLYGNKSDEELLAFDPNDLDAMDPNMFYELIAEKYGIAPDPNNDYFGGFGGPIHKLIAFVESRWDGETRKDTPMPPGDWLEEYVHPES